MTGLDRVRAAWAAALLLAPRLALGELPACDVDRPARVLARVLGVRQLLQLMLCGGRRERDRRRILAGAGADGLHAGTMVLLALIRPERRRLGLSNAAISAAMAIAGVRRARPPGRPTA